MLTVRRGRTTRFLNQMKPTLISDIVDSVFWSTDIANIGAIKGSSFQLVGMSIMIEDAVQAGTKRGC